MISFFPLNLDVARCFHFSFALKAASIFEEERVGGLSCGVVNRINATVIGPLRQPEALPPPQQPIPIAL